MAKLTYCCGSCGNVYYRKTPDRKCPRCHNSTGHLVVEDWSDEPEPRTFILKANPQ